MDNERVERQWRELFEQGAFVFPLPAGGKNPGDLGIRWKNTWIDRARNPWPQLATAHFDAAGLWLATGQISKRVVLDIDKAEAGDYWRDKIGEDLYNRSLTVETSKGYHLHFRIPADDDRPWPSHSNNDLGYDLRADGGGVVLPPSIHESGFEYKWKGGELFDVPECLRHPVPKAPQAQSNVASLDRAREKRSPGSTLAGLLADPPEQGGRNNWLTKVAGHLAKIWPGPMQDGYDQLLQYIGQSLPDPLDEAEIAKTASSVWDREKSHSGIEAFSDESGQLVGRDGKMYTRRKGEDGNFYVTEWADFEVKARRVVQEDEERVFYVDIETAHTTYLNEPLRADVLGNIHRLNVWMAAHHCSIIGHPQDVCKMSYGTRLTRYLLSQDPAPAQTAFHYGQQDDGSFLVPEGLVEGGGVVPHRSVIPARHLSGWVNYRYGSVPVDEAVSVLREVMTFQDETVSSVFGAWWVMSILKGRYQTSLFPFMMLEAGSESGKTTGFFAMMVALAGSRDGAGQHTVASFRDAVAAHRNGIAWLDDMTEMSTGQVIDIIRQATSEGSRGKKSGDNKSNERITLISPIMISGEGSGTMMSEKAMADRSIQLRFGSPKGRRSLSDPGRPQWDDILALQARYGGGTKGLSGVSGTLVAQVLARSHLLDQMASLRPNAGRVADKWAILRTGARILDDLLGSELGGQSCSQWVDLWVESQKDTGAANLAVNEIIPWALRNAGGGLPMSPRGKQPAYYNQRSSTIWVHVGTLADRWLDRNHITARERQLGSEAAIETELKAIGCGPSHVKKYGPRTAEDSGRARYVELPVGYTAQILERAGFEVVDDPADDDTE